MKKLMFAALACLGLAMTGCKPDSDWTPEKTYELGLKIGGTAGAVVQAQHYDAKITDKSLEVVDLVVGLVPDKGQTFKEVWSPKISEFLDKQTDMSAITKLGVSLISGVLISSLDKKIAENPEILEQKELVVNLLRGVSDGYKTYIKPSNTVKIMSGPRKPELIVEIDQDLYKEMEKQLKQK